MRKSLFQFITTIALTLLLCLTFSCQRQVEEEAEEAKPAVGVKANEEAIKSLLNETLEQTQIAFHSRIDGNMEIYVMNADGSEQKRLTNNPAPDWKPSWSPFLKTGK